MPVREQIGRYKYIVEEKLDAEYENVMNTLAEQIKEVCGREDF